MPASAITPGDLPATAHKPPAGVTAPAPIRILKIGTCPSLSGKSELTYHVGCKAAAEVQLRAYANTGGGYFNKEWTPLAIVQQLLAKVPGDKAITSFVLHPLFQGRSVNTAAFLFAALKAEGLVQPGKDKGYQCTDATAFFTEVKALITANVSLKVEEKLTKVRAKAAKAKSNAGVPAKDQATSSSSVLPVHPADTDTKGDGKAGQDIDATQQTVTTLAPMAKQPWPIKATAPKVSPKKA